MDISAKWTSEERFEVAKVLSRAGHEDKEHAVLTPYSWGLMRRMTRLVYIVLNESEYVLETNRTEIVMEYLKRLREQEPIDKARGLNSKTG